MNQRFIKGLVLGFILLHSSHALAETHEELLRRAAVAKEQAMDQQGARQSWYSVYELFLAVDALEPSAATHYELGVAASHLEAEDLAADHFAAALKMGLDDPARSKAATYLQRLHGRLGRVVIVADAGVRVYARGFLRAIAPTSNVLRLPVGATTLECVPPEGGPVTKITVQLGPDDEQLVRVPSVEEAAHPPSETESRPPENVLRPAAAAAVDLPWSRARLRRAESRKINASGTEPPIRGGHGRLQLAGFVLGPGAGLLVSSGLAAALSQLKVEGYRDQLAAVCSEPLQGTRDGCAHAMEGRYDAARALAREIAQWRTIRAVSWAGVGVGAAATALGVWLLLKDGDVPRSSSWAARVSFGTGAFAVDVTRPF